MKRRLPSSYLTTIILLLTLILGWVIRTAPLSALQEMSVLGPDSARYLRQAKIIAEQGHLPEVDSLRLHPIGKDSDTQLTIYPYTLVFLYRGVSLFFRGVTIENIATFSSLVFFSLGLIVFCFLITRLLAWPTALLATNLCVVAPSTLGRSVVGYADRDAFCLFLALGSYYLYIRAYQSEQLKTCLILGFLSGLAMALLGLAWQGVGLFMGIVVLLNFVLFLLPNYRRADSYLYFIWLIPVLIGLLGLKTVYRDFSQAHVMLAIVLPCFFVILVLIFQMLSKSPKLSDLCTFHGKIPLSFAITVMATALGGLVLLFFSEATDIINRAWTHFLSPFGSGRFAASIEELQKRGAMGWFIWPGYFLVFMVGGTLLLMKRAASDARMNIWVSLTLFELLLAGTIFTRLASMENSSYESALTTSFYLVALIVYGIGMTAAYLWSYQKRKDVASQYRPSIGDLFLLASFCILLFAVRGAMRFEFFFAPIAIAAGCYAFVYLLENLGVPNRAFGWLLLGLLTFESYAIVNSQPGINRFQLPTDYSFPIFSVAVIIAIGISAIMMRSTFVGWKKTPVFRFAALAMLVFLLITMGGFTPVPWLGGYANLSYVEAAELRPFVTPTMSRAFEWLKRNTSQSSVIAAWWDYGSLINLLSRRTTIVDEEQLVYWGHLMARDVLFAETDQQALRFLKAHGATHLLITARELQGFQTISVLASDRELDLYGFLMYCPTSREIIQSKNSGTIFKYAPEAHGSYGNEPITVNGEVFPAGAWKVNGIYLKLESSKENDAQLLSALIEVETSSGVIQLKPKEFYYDGKMYQQSGSVLPGTLLISSHADNPLDWEIFYLSPKVQNTLMVKLYLLNSASEFFQPVYPLEAKFQGSHSDPTDFQIRIWEIHYPLDLPTEPQYLVTEFPNRELHRLWMESESPRR